VGTGRELPDIRETQILSDQEARLLLRRCPDFLIPMPDEALMLKCMDVMTYFFEVLAPSGAEDFRPA